MIIRIYDRLILGLAALAAACLGSMIFAIVIDVVLRNIGLRPFQANSALIEYGMLFATMAGAPWLVREHGHVAIMSFVDLLPEAVQGLVRRIVLALSIGTLLLLSWRAGAVGLETIEAGAIDIRSIYIPAWVLYAMLSGGFGLMSLEFLRLWATDDLRLGARARH